jgi:hypothetical protein
MVKGASLYVSMSDAELVEGIKTSQDEDQVKDMTHVLYMRYMNFIHKHWHALSRQLNASYLVQDIKEDFYSESYVSFSKALAAINLEKIQNNKWKFLGYFGFYLSNQRNTFAKRIIRKYQEETPIEIPEASGERTIYLSDISEKGAVASAEDTFMKEEQRRGFWAGLTYCRDELWSDVERRIFDMREKGQSIKAICAELEMSPWKCNKILSRMKQQFKQVAELPSH